MLQTVDTGRRTLAEYESIAGEQAVEELRALARPLRGARVLQINATPYAGGVSELLRSLVPLERDLGLVSDAVRSRAVTLSRGALAETHGPLSFASHLQFAG